MTVAAAIPCKDGLILCADTEETITDEQKRTASKIQVVVHMSESNKFIQATSKVTDTFSDAPWAWRGDWVVGIAGAGHSDWIEAFIEGMSESVLNKTFGKRLRLQRLHQLINQYAEEFFVRYIKNYSDDPARRPQANMLIAAQSRTRNEIFRINDNVMLRDEWGSGCVAVGKGAPTFQHLAKHLIDSFATMKQLCSTAVYILSRVKSEVPGCGGKSHVVMIGRNGYLQSLSAKRVMQLELHHAELESKMYKSFAQELLKEIP
ncbi:MAG TPA: hypothetical protein VGR97_14565 [Candidatus Acidoferrales bacterium]|nr:hypothetical protein [Candidatus Acidoferrales bacterium]